MDRYFTEKKTTETEDGVKAEKTIGKDGNTEWEKTEVEYDDVAPMYREAFDESGRRVGTAEPKAVVGDSDYVAVQGEIDDDDKAWLDILWRSPSDSDARYHKAVYAFKQAKGLDNSEDSKKIIEETFGLDENGQAVDYPTKEGLAFLMKAVDTPNAEIEIDKEEGYDD